MKVILMVLLMLSSSTALFAQYRITAVNFILEPESIRSASLGNSLVAFEGYSGAHHLNPASLNHQNIPTLGFIRNEQQVASQWTITWMSLYAGQTFGAMDIAVSYRSINSDPPNFNSTQNSEINEFLGNVTTSYSFGSGFRAGFGLNYIHSKHPENESINGQPIEPGKSWSADIGVQYQKERPLGENWSMTPMFGTSLTDFGGAVSYSDDNPGDPLPMKLRLGSGLKVESNKRIRGMSALGVNASLGFSKLMARKELKVTNNNGFADSSYVPMKPFKALFSSWDTYTWFDGMGENRATLREQIWTHVGLEFNFLETLSFRFGYQDGGKPNVTYDLTSFGIGLNLGYLQFDYIQTAYTDRLYKEDSKWQLTGRIPLDGHRPNSILHELFK